MSFSKYCWELEMSLGRVKPGSDAAAMSTARATPDPSIPPHQQSSWLVLARAWICLVTDPTNFDVNDLSTAQLDHCLGSRQSSDAFIQTERCF